MKENNVGSSAIPPEAKGDSTKNSVTGDENTFDAPSTEENVTLVSLNCEFSYIKI